MSGILQGSAIGTPVMLEAMEANLAEEMMSFGRGLPGGEVREDAELHWFITGSPHLNGVTRTYLAKDDKDYIDAKIVEAQHAFQARGVGFNWAVGPTARPSNLGNYLEHHGFSHRHEDTTMAVVIPSMY